MAERPCHDRPIHSHGKGEGGVSELIGGTTRPYAGICIGGPWDGMSMAHDKRKRPLWREAAREHRAKYIGDYIFNSRDKEWHWEPTP